MLVYNSRLIGTPVLSVQAGGKIANIATSIVDPDKLKIVAFKLSGPTIDSANEILIPSSIREYSNIGMVIDDAEELVSAEDVVKIKKVLELNFDPLGLKVETKKGAKLGQVINFIVTTNDFIVQQIIVRRPLSKRFLDPELTIHRREIIEVTDRKIIIKDEKKDIRARASKEDLAPSFVNPFRSQEPGFAPADTKTPADKDN